MASSSIIKFSSVPHDEKVIEENVENGHIENGIPNEALISNVSGSLEPTIVKKNPPTGCWRVRDTLALLGFIGFAIASSIRVSLSVAIVAMVKSPAMMKNLGNSTLSDACPVEDEVGDEPSSTSPSSGEFEWDETTQGLILGSYFYGYVATNVVAGRAAEHFGGKVVFGLGIVFSAILTLATPFSAWTSTGLFVAVRVLQGAASGAIYPSMNAILPIWIPPLDRAKYSTIIYAGMDLGTVLSLPLTGWLCALPYPGGWPMVFYLFGGLGIVWGVTWFLLVSDYPELHPTISDEEKTFLAIECGVRERKAGSLPWRQIMTSLPVWSLLIVHVGQNWGAYTLLTQLPTYLKNIQHFDMKSNGLLSALPYLAMWVYSLAHTGAMSLLSHRLSILNIRRLSMTIASCGPMFGLVALCFVDCNSALVMALMCFVIGINGAIYSGYMCSHQDLAPNFAGTLFGITNTAANIPGFLAPQLSGAITDGNQTLSAWRTVFLISAAVYFVTGTIYVMFVSATKQPWNDVKERKEDIKNNI